MGNSVQVSRSRKDQPVHGQSNHDSLWLGLGGIGKAR